MAIVFGAAGEHAARQSVGAFKKMFLTLTAGIATLTAGLGSVWALIFTANVQWLTALVGTVVFVAGAAWLTRVLGRRVDKYETERMSWRMGALGECEVAAELERLSDKFTVFNNVNTKRGNLDHIVLGPTGLFAIETKNWTGFISATAGGELSKNGRASTASHVRKFLGRAMMVRDQVMVLTHLEIRIRAVMVFPKAYVEAPYGKTGKVHCVRLNRLRDYIEDAKFSAKLTNVQTDQLARALQGIAAMDVDFAEAPTAAVERTPSDPVITTVAAQTV